MNPFASLFKLAGALALSWLALIGPGSAPTASLRVSSGHPSAGTPVRFEDRSSGEPSAWEWSFGDGTVSTERNPKHVFPSAGSYPVTLKVRNGAGESQTTSMVAVSDENTLTLLSAAGHSFEITLDAVNPANGAQGKGVAVPQNDVFGYFTIPDLVPRPPGAPLVPEVFVKMLDARAIGQDFWLFWGGLTGLEYTLTVRDTVRGTQKVEHNPVTADPHCLSADTSGFANVPSPTPTSPGVSPTPTPTPGQAHVVEIHSDFFRDSVTGNNTTTIHVGDTIEWQWINSGHSTTSGNCPPCTGDGNWTSQINDSGAKFDHTFTQAGNFPYFCMVHLTMMTGTVVVNP